MRLLDWLKSRRREPGDAAGDRIASAIRNHQRLELDLPPQRLAQLIDSDGTTHVYGLDIQRNGEPHGEVKITYTYYSGDKPVQKIYCFWKEQNDYLVYTEIET